eukprot:360124-Chlamydomonas_euryale.AAC.7
MADASGRSHRGYAATSDGSCRAVPMLRPPMARAAVRRKPDFCPPPRPWRRSRAPTPGGCAGRRRLHLRRAARRAGRRCCVNPGPAMAAGQRRAVVACGQRCPRMTHLPASPVWLVLHSIFCFCFSLKRIEADHLQFPDVLSCVFTWRTIAIRDMMHQHVSFHDAFASRVGRRGGRSFKFDQIYKKTLNHYCISGRTG